MTNKITKEFLFTELSIKIATLEMKLDKVLELLNKPEYEIVVNPCIDTSTEFKVEEFQKSFNEQFDEEFK